MAKRSKSFEEWQKLAEGELRGKPVAGLDWTTPEGITVKPLYTEADLDEIAAAGFPFRDAVPGEPPYLRGPRATMYANRPWTIRQYSGFSTAEESNRFYRDNLKAGQMGLSIAFDLATHRGYDSDHPRVVGDVGKAGVAIDSVEDMKILFDGIPLDKMSVSMTMNGAVLPVLAGFIVAAEEQGVRRNSSRGRSRTTSSRSSWSATPISTRPDPRCGSSPTSSSTPRGTCPSSTRSRSPATTWRRPERRRCRNWPSPSPTGSNTCAPRLSRGLDIDEFAPRLSFFFGIGMNFFMEIAKLRAARLLWARLIEPFGRRTR
jgi:methylmalonyl-CoA mutase